MKRQKIWILRGIPASGKTTWAKTYQKTHPNTKRLNRDDLRMMIDNGVWSKQNEKFIVETRDFLLDLFLTEGFDVIIDDTNLVPKSFEQLIKTIQEKREQMEFNGVTILLEVKIFEVDLEECIIRDSKRIGKAKVGEAVIRRFYNNYVDKNTNK
jgi:predicted kinase